MSVSRNRIFQSMKYPTFATLNLKTFLAYVLSHRYHHVEKLYWKQNNCTIIKMNFFERIVWLSYIFIVLRKVKVNKYKLVCATINRALFIFDQQFTFNLKKGYIKGFNIHN